MPSTTAPERLPAEQQRSSRPLPVGATRGERAIYATGSPAGCGAAVVLHALASGVRAFSGTGTTGIVVGTCPGLSAALAATVFHFGTLSVAQVKEECVRRGFPMRWPLEDR